MLVVICAAILRRFAQAAWWIIVGSLTGDHTKSAADKSACQDALGLGAGGGLVGSSAPLAYQYKSPHASA